MFSIPTHLTAIAIVDSATIDRLPVTAQNRPDCSAPMTQAEINFCANEEFAEVDAELNCVYNRVIGNLSETRRELLIDAQLDWIDYRDAQCELAGSAVAGGALQPLYISTCKTTLTEVRTAELSAYGENRYPGSNASDLATVDRQHRDAFNTRCSRSNVRLVDASERAWQNYRNTACEFERSGGGNAAFENCRIRLTERRIQELNRSSR